MVDFSPIALTPTFTPYVSYLGCTHLWEVKTPLGFFRGEAIPLRFTRGFRVRKRTYTPRRGPYAIYSQYYSIVRTVTSIGAYYTYNVHIIAYSHAKLAHILA